MPTLPYSLAADLLRQIGAKVAVVSFRDLQSGNATCGSVPTYNGANRAALVDRLAAGLVPAMSNLVVAMVSQGIVVVVVCSDNDRSNGDPNDDEAVGGYLFRGATLIRRSLERHFGPDLARLIRVEQDWRWERGLTILRRAYRLLANYQLLCFSSLPSLTVRLRHKNFLVYQVGDHMYGIQLN